MGKFSDLDIEAQDTIDEAFLDQLDVRLTEMEVLELQQQTALSDLERLSIRLTALEDRAKYYDEPMTLTDLRELQAELKTIMKVLR